MNKVESRKVLFLLIGLDLILIILHLAHLYTPYFSDSHFSLSKERGFGEIFQYLKEGAIVLMFGYLSILKSERSYLLWCLLFGYVLLDDSFALHERIGNILANRFNFQPLWGLRAQDFGELSVHLFVGTFFLLALLSAYFWRGSREFRRSSTRIIMLLFLLAFCGIVFDSFHTMLTKGTLLSRLAGVVEDGGEMVVISLICCDVLRLLGRARSIDHPTIVYK